MSYLCGDPQERRATGRRARGDTGVAVGDGGTVALLSPVAGAQESVKEEL